MIVFLENTQIDREKWDACILKSVNGLAYAYSWYLDIIHDNWSALVDGDYESVMPLTLKSKFGITYFYQPFFAQQLGVFSKLSIGSESVEKFIVSIPSNVKVVDFNLNHFNKFSSERFNLIDNINYVLDLISDYQKIADSYSTNTKRNLKKAIKNKLVSSESINPQEIVNLFRENRGKSLTSWDEGDYSTLIRLMYTSIHKGMGISVGVYTEYNELCAAAFFLKTSDRLIFLFSGSNDIARSNGAMTFLIDSIIKANSPSKKILDFEGSNDNNLARFYSGFGAQKSNYKRIKINRLNPILKAAIKVFSSNK